jgi:hypothetical protein
MCGKIPVSARRVTARLLLRHCSFAAALGVLAALGLPAMAGSRAAPVITAGEARALLALSGANVGTTRLLQGVGLVRIDAIDVHSEGRWLVIRLLPTLVKRAGE